MGEVEKILKSGRFPSRQPAENLADLSAQVASLRMGMDGMQEILQDYGVQEISEQMKVIFEVSSTCTKGYFSGLGNLPNQWSKPSTMAML